MQTRSHDHARIPVVRRAGQGVLVGTVILGALAVGAVASGCRKTEAASAAKVDTSVPVTLGRATLEPVQRTVEVVGTLVGDEDTTISNKVPGKVIAIYHDIGDRVKPGEPLAQLLQKDYELEVSHQAMLLQESLAKLGMSAVSLPKGMDVPPPDFDVSDLPAVRKARLQEQNARAKYNRGKKLHDQQPPLMSDQDFADLQTTWDVAKSGYDVELLTARSLVSEANTHKAELEIARQALSDTTIRAPMLSSQYGVTSLMPAEDPSLTKKDRSYVIVARFGSVGELKPLITQMFRLVDDDPIKFRPAVPERYFTEIKAGQIVNVKVEAYPDLVFPGVISRKNSQVDPSNRTFPIEVIVPNPDRRLPCGAFARGGVETRIDPKVVFVPQEGVITFAGASKVFIVKEGKAQEIAVELGAERHKAPDGSLRVEVVNNALKGDEQIVVTGASKLATGVPVVIRAAADASAQDAAVPATQAAAGKGESL